MNKEKILASYSKVKLGLGHTKYNSGSYFAEDFVDISKLVNFLKDYQDGEAYLTKEGYKFLIEYYGLDELAQILKNHEPDFPYGDDRSVIEWLQHFKDAIQE